LFSSQSVLIENVFFKFQALFLNFQISFIFIYKCAFFQIESSTTNDVNNSNILNVAKNTLTKFLDDTLPDVKVEVKTDGKETKEDSLQAVNVIKNQNVTTNDDSNKSKQEKSGSLLDGKMIEKVVNIIQDSIDTSNGVDVNVDSKYLNLPKIQQKLIDDAATKIQAVFRGYQVRKSISRGASPSRPKQNTDEVQKAILKNEQNEKVDISLKDVNLENLKEKESLDALHKLDDALSQKLLSTDQVTDSSKQDINVESLTVSTNGIIKDSIQNLDVTGDGKDSKKMNISSEIIDSKVKSIQENVNNTQTSLKPEVDLSGINTSTVEMELTPSDLKLTTQEKDQNETSFKDTMTDKINVSEIDELSRKTSKLIKDQVSPVSESLEVKNPAMEDVEKEIQNVEENINKNKVMLATNIQEGVEKVKEEIVEKLDKDVKEFSNDVSTSSQKEEDMKNIDTSGATNSSLESNLIREKESEGNPKESAGEKSPPPQPQEHTA